MAHLPSHGKSGGSLGPRTRTYSDLDSFQESLCRLAVLEQILIRGWTRRRFPVTRLPVSTYTEWSLTKPTKKSISRVRCGRPKVSTSFSSQPKQNNFLTCLLGASRRHANQPRIDLIRFCDYSIPNNFKAASWICSSLSTSKIFRNNKREPVT